MIYFGSLNAHYFVIDEVEFITLTIILHIGLQPAEASSTVHLHISCENALET